MWGGFSWGPPQLQGDLERGGKEAGWSTNSPGHPGAGSQKFWLCIQAFGLKATGQVGFPIGKMAQVVSDVSPSPRNLPLSLFCAFEPLASISRGWAVHPDPEPGEEGGPGEKPEALRGRRR